MQSKGLFNRTRAPIEEQECLLPPDALPRIPEYGSLAGDNKPFKGLQHPVKAIGVRGRESDNMSSQRSLRLISAYEVTIPPVKWYKRLYIPFLVTPRPSPHSNIIHTTKYTILNFIPKNLWEQFHRWANIYFLMIALLNFVPAVEAVGKEVAFIPLVFILGVTAGKDIFEDYRRYKSDGAVNKKSCHVYDRSSRTFVSRQWRHIRVGDFVRLLSDEVIPADMLLLRSSDPGGICYIDTANIDGETNLKQREVASGFFTPSPSEIEGLGGKVWDFDPQTFTGKVYCEQPHNKIYNFNGYIETAGGDTVGINRSNLLLRGCVLRNTQATVGVVVYAGHETKSMLNNSGPRIKRSKLERSINLDILSQVVILVSLCLIGAIANGVWTGKKLDLNAPFFPFTSEDTNTALEGFIRFWTFIIIFQVIVPISLYVTMEIVKFIQVYFINWDLDMYYPRNNYPFQCRALNISEDLGQIQHVFSDKTGTLTENQMVFKCCSVGGLNYPHSLAEELANVHQSQNIFVSPPPQPTNRDEVDWPDPPEKKTELDPGLSCRLSDPTVRDFFTVLAICNTVVISSSKPSPPPPSRASSAAPAGPPDAASIGQSEVLEATSERGSMVIDKDTIQTLKYEAESPDEAALVHAARDYGYALLSRTPHQCSVLTPTGEVIEYDILHMLHFDSNRKCMSVVVRQKGSSKIILYSKGADSAIYRNMRSCLESSGVFRESGFEEQDSDSLPSQIGVEGVEGERCRREDSGSGTEELSQSVMGVALLRDKTQTFMDDYAKLGLRTLCMAKREFTDEEYSKWLLERRNAEVAIEDRDTLLFESARSAECRLELLGATGIEDKLQTKVPEAIADLLEAGMKVWVLTGDKQETAINVGYSTHLINPDMEVVVLNAYSLDDCKSELLRIRQRLAGHTDVAADESDDSIISTSPQDALRSKLIRLRMCRVRTEGKEGEDKKALVVDGATLTHALDPSLKKLFLEVSEKFHSVLCCRATPLQKAGVVELVKCGCGSMTLAVGDGANDVSMIQKADVGVGIAGKEGMQAVMASDFAMGRFHFLVKLLLVHGHWCYARLARLMLYFFYKNVAFAVLLFYYQIFNAFSGSAPIDSINLLIFNLVFTSLPIIVVGVADQDLLAPVLLKEKELYRQGQCSQVYTRLDFWLTVVDAFYQSAVVFFVALGAYHDTDVGVTEFGFVLNMCIVVVVSLHLAIETLYWTFINHIILWGSVIFTFAFNYVYCAIDTQQRLMDTLFVLQRASLRAEFWLVLILVPVIALLPRLLAKIMIQELHPSPVSATRARIRRESKRKAAELTTTRT